MGISGKSILTIFLAIVLLMVAIGSAYDFSTETITKTVGEQGGVWPVINITLKELSDVGIKIKIVDPDAVMTIYRLSDLGKATGVTVYVQEWNRSPPILFMDKNGSLAHSIANESQLHTQTRIIIYDESTEEIQQRVIDPWGNTDAIAQRVSYPIA